MLDRKPQNVLEQASGIVTGSDNCGVNASGGDVDKPVDQARYLASYLSNPELSAKSLVVETPYVDRHYLEEYARYYATALRPPNPKVSRLHFFTDLIDDDGLLRLLREAAGGRHEESEQYLQSRYLGITKDEID